MATFFKTTGNVVGTADVDTLVADYSTLTATYPYGIHLNINGEQNIRDRGPGTPILTYSSIEQFNVTGTNSKDKLEGGNYGDIFNGMGDNDELLGNGGNDSLYGGDGNDTLSGGDGDDILDGGNGIDSLDGGAGDDMLYGGAGDTLIDFNGNNQFYANEGTARGTGTLHLDYRGYDHAMFIGGDDGVEVYEKTDSGYQVILRMSSFSGLVVQASEHDDIVDGGGIIYNDNAIYGNGGNDYINARTGNDFIDGGTGNDTLIGGDGNDYIAGGDGNDDIYESEGYVYGGNGYDTLFVDSSQLGSSGTGIHIEVTNDGIWDLVAGNQFFTIDGIERVSLTGTQYADELLGGNADDILNGMQGNDIVNGGGGDDTIYSVTGIDGAVRHLTGGAGKDTFMLDVSGDINIDYNFKFNTQGLAQFINDITLPEDTGPDWGRIGADVAFDVYAAVVGGVPGIGPALGFLTGVGKTGFDTYADQQALHDQIKAQTDKAAEVANSSYYNSLNWGDITTTTTGVRDTVFIDDFQIGNDMILLPKIDNTDTTKAAYSYSTRFGYFPGTNDKGIFISVNQNGGGLTEGTKDIVFIKNNYKNAGIDDTEFEATIQNLLINGQIGRFNDTPVLGTTGGDNLSLNTDVSFANDVIYAGAGNDRVYGFYGDDLIEGQEGNDILFGGTDNDQNYVPFFKNIYETDGNDYISGGDGDDKLYGETGDDYLNGDSTNGKNGAEKVFVGNGNDFLSGGEGDDILEGGNGNDVLNGGTGSDQMNGGTGNDIYFVDIIGDSVDETNGGGIDTVNSSITYTLGTAIENLTLTGTAAINGTGNALNNILTGNSAVNTLTGLTGNDTYFITSGDIVKEAASAGTDTVKAGFTYTLGANLENLTLTGTSAINGTGNALNNILTGNSAINTLTGLTGNDTYFITSGDIVNEAAGAGTDTVKAGFSYTLGTNVENLTLTGTGAINGTGNGLVNLLIGNASANILAGGLGNDTLTGGAGADKFLFNTAINATTNKDIITDFNVVDDTLRLENAIFTKFTTAGALTAGTFVSGAGAKALDANDYLIYNTTNGTLSYDADGNGVGAKIDIVTLIGIPALTTADFAII